MSLMTKGKRDFVKERLAEKPARKVARNNRNKARRKMGLKNGDGKVVDHKDNNPLNNGKKNLKITTKKANDAKQATRKKREAKKK